MRTIVFPAALLGFAALSLAGAAGIANAASTSGITATPTITKNTTAYELPTELSPTVQTLPAGTQVDALCWVNGQELDGNSFWFRVSDDGARPGFVHRAAISGVSGDLEHC